MAKIVLLLVISLHVVEISGQIRGISSKLDFNNDGFTNNHDSTLSTSLIKALVHLQQSDTSPRSILSSKLGSKPFSLETVAQIERKSEPKLDFANLGLLCIDGNCNITKGKTATADGKPSTDILVQISANVNKNNNNNNPSPVSNDDVPVIVGYAGTNIKNNGNINQENQRSDVFDTNKSDRRNHYIYSTKQTNEVYGQNMFNQRVPYFQPSYNNHYFGEEPPPHFVWHRRITQPAYNPQGFQMNNRQYKPQINWKIKFPSDQYISTSWMATTVCSCNKPGLNWYPSVKPPISTIRPVISDKMGDLQ